MGFWDGAGWVAIGGYYLASDMICHHKKQLQGATIREQIESLTDEKLQRALTLEICSATEDDFERIWLRIENFKRECPHLLYNYPMSYWQDVGKMRYWFTEDLYKQRFGRKKLTKSDLETIRMERGCTITLLMNTYGVHSNMEATRMVYKMHHLDYGWTWELG